MIHEFPRRRRRSRTTTESPAFWVLIGLAAIAATVIAVAVFL